MGSNILVQSAISIYQQSWN